MDRGRLEQRDRFVPYPKPVHDFPAVTVGPGDIERGIRELAKRIGRARTFKALRLRERNPSVAARARAKARGAESRRRQDASKRAKR
jgi:ribosomal protein S21